MKVRPPPKFPEEYELVKFTRIRRAGRYDLTYKGERWTPKRSYWYPSPYLGRKSVKPDESSGDEAPEQKPAPKKEKIKKLLNVEVPYSNLE